MGRARRTESSATLSLLALSARPRTSPRLSRPSSRRDTETPRAPAKDRLPPTSSSRDSDSERLPLLGACRCCTEGTGDGFRGAAPGSARPDQIHRYSRVTTESAKLLVSLRQTHL